MHHLPLIIIALFGLACNSSNSKQSASVSVLKKDSLAIIDIQEAQSFLRNFYNAYITQVSKMNTDSTELNPILLQYCSDHVIKQQNEFVKAHNYDILINGQFCDTSWLRTFEVTRDQKNINAYTISFRHLSALNNTLDTIKIKLQLVQVDHRLLIGKVFP